MSGGGVDDVLSTLNGMSELQDLQLSAIHRRFSPSHEADPIVKQSFLDRDVPLQVDLSFGVFRTWHWSARCCKKKTMEWAALQLRGYQDGSTDR